MGSFGETDSREKSPVYATHSPELANGFVWFRGVGFVWETAPHPKMASFGESPLAQGIGTFRNSAHHNGSMGSFGETDSREKSPVYATHSPELANGFVWSRGVGFVWETAPHPKLASFGESPLAQGIGTFRNSAHHNGSMGSFGETDSREKSPVYATHSPELANGFVWSRGVGFVRGGGRSLAVQRRATMFANCQGTAGARLRLTSSGAAAIASRESFELRMTSFPGGTSALDTLQVHIKQSGQILLIGRRRVPAVGREHGLIKGAMGQVEPGRRLGDRTGPSGGEPRDCQHGPVPHAHDERPFDFSVVAHPSASGILRIRSSTNRRTDPA